MIHAPPPPNFIPFMISIGIIVGFLAAIVIVTEIYDKKREESFGYDVLLILLVAGLLTSIVGATIFGIVQAFP